MKKTPEQISKEWLFFAGSDLRLAKLALRDKIYHETCFLSHQSAEKSLKAILARKESVIPKTHSLNFLNKLVFQGFGKENLPPEQAQFLDQFYLPSRYPDAFPGNLPEGLPQKKDAGKALKFAGNFFYLATKLIQVK